MKIKILPHSYGFLSFLPPYRHKKPKKQSKLLASLVRLLTKKDLQAVSFSCNEDFFQNGFPKEPCLLLMNHSSFIDLEMVFTLLSKRPFHIVETDDGFVGMEGLMRHLGNVPTRKFQSDPTLVQDMAYCLRELQEDVLMFPEAGYTFDGTTGPLPSSLGKLIKHLGVPVVLIKTHGAFLRDPLYNNLRKRNVRVSAEGKVLFAKEEVASLGEEELFQRFLAAFSYDHFREQRDLRIRVGEPFRADGLERVLYKCPHCLAEGATEGKGTKLFCHACEASYVLDEYGVLSCENGETKFDSVPAWYAWERECARKEVEEGTYRVDEEVDLLAMRDFHALYKIGEGRLIHDIRGFHLSGCHGDLDFEQSPLFSHSVNADFYYYELGDMVCIGDAETHYYCFPKNQGKHVVAKIRLAAEEMHACFKASEK